MKKKALSVIIGIFISSFGFSQMVELPLLYSLKTDYYHQAAINKDSIHLSYATLYSNELSNSEEFPYVHVDTSRERNWFGRKLFDENFLILDKENIYLTFDLIYNFSVGSDLSDSTTSTLYTNTRGIQIAGVLGKNILFSTSFLENQARFPSYVNTFIENNGVVPGMGRVKDFKTEDYDYAMATASITWLATKFMSIKLGNDKDFLGFGYRSVLLSDNAFNYPHLKLDFWFAERKLKYSLNYVVLQDLIRLPKGETPESLFERKMGAFHYLSYMPNRKITLGLFSGTILPQTLKDSVNNFYLDAFNPIFMVNPIINNPDYVNKVGFNFSWEIWKDGRFYFEFADDPANWKQVSFLAGFTTWDLFIPGLDLTLEFTSSNNTNNSSSNQNMTNSYSHYSQSLAHVLGSGFNELYARLNYNYDRFHFLVSLNYANRDIEDGKEWGFIDHDMELPNVHTSYTNSVIMNTEISYLFNPKINMNLALGYRLKRSGMESIFGKTDYLYLAFRTTLFNQYLDF